MIEDEYIALRRKELHLVRIKVAEKNKVKGFSILFNLPFPVGCLPGEEYRVSELALRELDKEGIEYKVKK